MWSLSLRDTCLLVFIASACASSESFQPLPYELETGAAVRIRTGATVYSPGAAILLRVENLGSIEYVWNPCVRSLERSTAAGWILAEEGERWCTLEGWLLKRGHRADASTQVAGGFPPGEYRLRYGFGRVEGDFSVNDYQVSNVFVIAP